MTALYNVETWDVEFERYTPATEAGVQVSLVDRAGLRRALKALREIGYSAHRNRDSCGCHTDNDPDVLVYRVDLACDYQTAVEAMEPECTHTTEEEHFFGRIQVYRGGSWRNVDERKVIEEAIIALADEDGCLKNGARASVDGVLYRAVSE